MKETRRELIDRTALRLFAERGYAEVSVRDIAQECGIGESGLYRHMASKEELAIRVFREAYLGFAQEMVEAAPCDGGLRAALDAFIEVVLKGFDKDPILMRFLLLRQHDTLAQAITLEDMTPLTVVRACIVGAMNEKEIPHMDPDVATAMVMGAVLQPMTFMLYGRISAPAISHKNDIFLGASRTLGLQTS
jgi:AcrR family transcriptional regulator